jgi:glycosyltransferase involved in cell wall biosynthesis
VQSDRSRLRIYMLSTDFLPAKGGIAAHVFELSKSLVQAGHEVHVVTLRRQLFEDSYENLNGIDIHRLYYPRIRVLGAFAYILIAYVWLQGSILRRRINVIHAHTIFDAFLGKLLRGTPRVATEHSSGFLEALETGKRINRYRWIYSSFDTIVGPSCELVNSVNSLALPAKTKVLFLSNGVDTERFSPLVSGSTIRKKNGIGRTEPVILCPRRLEPKNGVIYLVKAAPIILEKYNAARILVVGNGTQREVLEGESARLNVQKNVTFVGAVSNDRMPEFYAASDIVVLPSLKEATSIAGLEAMASGKPLVGSNVGGIPQIIKEGESGVLVPAKDFEKLADAIIHLLDNRDARAAMGKNARERANLFDWHVIAKAYSCIYKQNLSCSE